MSDCEARGFELLERVRERVGERGSGERGSGSKPFRVRQTDEVQVTVRRRAGLSSVAPNMNRTIVIGDVHGCTAEAKDLLQKIGPSREDRVIFTGDLVDRGPDPRGAVELAMQFESILGNHEETHLARRRSAPHKLTPDHLRTRSSLGDEHYDWMARLPHIIDLPEHEALVVHAGLFPNRLIDEQDPYHLLHIQCIDGRNRKSYWPSKAPPEATFWANGWRGPERVIFGHTVVDHAFVSDFAAAVDTGCAHGGALTALILPEWTFVSVPSRQRHGADDRIASYEIMPGVRCYS